MPLDVRVRVWTAASSAVSFTIPGSQLRSWPTVGGQDVDPSRGRADSKPWTVEVLDNGNYLSSRMADAAGRPVLLGRLIDCQLSSDGMVTWRTIGAGRIQEFVDHVAYYDVVIQDERYRERSTMVFTKQNIPISTARAGSSSDYCGSRLWPAGLTGVYGPFAPNSQGLPGRISSRDGTLRFVQFYDPGNPVDNAAVVMISNALTNVIRGDVKPAAQVDNAASAGNFNFLRCNVDGVDFEVASFDYRSSFGQFSRTNNIFGTADGGVFGQGAWLIDPTTALSSGGNVGALYFHMPSAPPSSSLPLHIGGRDGMHPVQLVQDMYDAAGIRYSSTAMTDLLTDSRYGRARWRITGQENMATWLEDHIYAVYGVLPFINSSGEVSLKSIVLPSSLPAGVQTYLNKHVQATPSWSNTARDMITAIVVHFTREDFVATPLKTDGDWPADLINPVDVSIELQHDRLIAGTAPRKVIDLQADGIHVFDVLYNSCGDPFFAPNAFMNVLGREIFDRFGDGPIRGTLTGLTSDAAGLPSPEPGAIIGIQVDTFPSLNTGARGGIRYAQVMSRSFLPGSFPDVEWLDAGPTSALDLPTLALAQSTSTPNHFLAATVPTSSMVGTLTGGWELQTIASSAGAAPGSSAPWHWAAAATSSGTFFVGPYPSGSKIWGKVRQRDVSRIRTGFGSAVNSSTAQIAVPPALAASSVGANTVVITWTVADNNYPVEVRASTAALGPSSSQRVAILPPGSNYARIGGLSSGSTYNIGVRHIDQWGGVGAENSFAVQTSGGAPTCPDVLAVRIVKGTT